MAVRLRSPTNPEVIAQSMPAPVFTRVAVPLPHVEGRPSAAAHAARRAPPSAERLQGSWMASAHPTAIGASQTLAGWLMAPCMRRRVVPCCGVQKAGIGLVVRRVAGVTAACPAKRW